MNRAEIKGDETLFIDENKENVIKARKAGLNAIYHNPKDEIINSLDMYLAQYKL